MKPSNKSIEIKMHVDENIDSYKNYIPDNWIEELLKLVTNGSVLDYLVLKLVGEWRCASYTAQLPAVLTKGFLSAALGRSSFTSPDSSISQMSEAIIQRLCNRLPDLKLNDELTRKLSFHLLEISREMADEIAIATRQANDSFKVQSIWEQNLREQSFRLTLRDSQRSAFMSVFHAYENFLISCLKIGSNVSHLRITKKTQFEDAMDRFSCQEKQVIIWKNDELNMFKLARNALAHNGGLLTDDLKRKPDRPFLVADGELQILPRDVHGLINLLIKGVDAIVVIAREKEAFNSPYRGRATE